MFEASVQASNAEGSSPIFKFSYVVEAMTPPPPNILQVQPDGYAGVTGSVLEAVVDTDQNVAQWSWEFGLGATPSTSSEERPQITLGVPGVYSAQVTVTDPLGRTDQHTFAYEVLPDEPIPVSVAVQAIDFGVTGPEIYSASVLNIGGLPAVTFFHKKSDTLFDVTLTSAIVATPGGPADWRTHVVDTVFSSSGAIQIKPVRQAHDRIYWLYHRSNNELPCLAISDSPAPANATNWTFSELPDADQVIIRFGDIQPYMGGLAYLYSYVEPANSTPGLPRIGRFAFSATPEPQLHTDWAVQTLDTGFGRVSEPIAVIDNRIAFVASSGVEGLNEDRLFISKEPMPQSIDDWERHQPRYVPYFGGLYVRNHRLHLAYPLMRATTRIPLDPEDWDALEIPALRGRPEAFTSFEFLPTQTTQPALRSFFTTMSVFPRVLSESYLYMPRSAQPGLADDYFTIPLPIDENIQRLSYNTTPFENEVVWLGRNRQTSALRLISLSTQ